MSVSIDYITGDEDRTTGFLDLGRTRFRRKALCYSTGDSLPVIYLDYDEKYIELYRSQFPNANYSLVEVEIDINATIISPESN